MKETKNVSILHIKYNMPGDVETPRLIEVVERKISLIKELHSLYDITSTENKEKIKDLIKIELNVIENIIKLDM